MSARCRIEISYFPCWVGSRPLSHRNEVTDGGKNHALKRNRNACCQKPKESQGGQIRRKGKRGDPYNRGPKDNSLDHQDDVPAISVAHMTSCHSPYKKDTEGTPWIDVVEPDVGYALFHGDNRKITQSPLEGRGNRKFAEIQHFLL
jgi:hypothetical protein